ncbi:MFS transporter [Saccharothrix longispora]|uniref:MFS transporter n=1 Tax=Saccharothrix longispora TaxID=33920 RepID=UPI0031EF9985
MRGNGALSTLLRPRVLHLLAIALVARTSGAVMPVTLLVSLAQPYGYGIAAVVNGVYIALLAFVAPLRGRLLDRIGQRRAIVPMAATAIAFTVLTAVSVGAQWAWGWTLVTVAVAGLTSPPLNAALRTSWRTVVNGEEGPLKTVHSADSVLEEMGFVIAPLLAGLSLTALPPDRAYQLSVAVYVVVVTAYLLALRRYNLGERVAPSPPSEAAGTRRRAHRWIGPLAEPRMLLILSPLLLMGCIFGGGAIFIPAFTQHLGSFTWTGPLLAMISVGGVVGGIAYGALRWDADLWRKYKVLTLGFAIPSCFLVAVRPLWLLALLLLLSGLFVTPIFINAFLLVDREIAADSRNEANTWISAGTNLSNAVITVIVGSYVAGGRWTAALGVLSGCAAVGLAVALLTRVRSTTAPARARHDTVSSVD